MFWPDIAIAGGNLAGAVAFAPTVVARTRLPNPTIAIVLASYALFSAADARLGLWLSLACGATGIAEWLALAYYKVRG